MRAQFEGFEYSKDSFIRDGFFKTYRKNGQIDVIAFYKNDVQDSVSLSYYPNGTLMQKEFLSDGQHFGKQYAYFDDGEIKVVTYAFDDSTRMFTAKYNQKGELIKFEGISLWINAPKDMSTLKVGEKLQSGNVVMTLPKATTKLYLKVTDPNGIVVTDTSVSEFGNNLNSDWHVYEQTLSVPGQYSYEVSVKVIDSMTGRVIRRDSVKNLITVIR